MRYDPAAASGGAMQPGTYYFSVLEASDATSTNGNEMIKLKLLVRAGDFEAVSYDYLVNTPGGLWKVKMFCEETGLNFASGELSAQACIGKGGKATLDYDKRDLAKVKAGTASRAYLKVERYGESDNKEPVQADAPAPEDDSIPF